MTTGALPLELVGLTRDQARTRYRRHTLTVLAIGLVGWAVVVLASQAEIRATLRWASFPTARATVEPQPLPSLQDPRVLHWVDTRGVDRYGIPDPQETLKVGQTVRVHYDPDRTCGWDEGETFSDDVEGLLVCLVAVPLAAMLAYVCYRRRLWLTAARASRLGRRGRVPSIEVVGHYHYGFRRGLTVLINDRMRYVPLFRGQLTTALPNPNLLEPLNRDGRLVFGVRGTDRLVWSSARPHRWIIPWVPVVLTTAWLLLPIVLVPLTRAIVSPPQWC